MSSRPAETDEVFTMFNKMEAASPKHIPCGNRAKNLTINFFGRKIIEPNGGFSRFPCKQKYQKGKAKAFVPSPVIPDEPSSGDRDGGRLSSTLVGYCISNKHRSKTT